jgi:hypothetical protein
MEAALALIGNDQNDPTVLVAYELERKDSSGQVKVPSVWAKALAVNQGLG